MYILGITGYPGSECHDGSAAILKDGVVLAAAEQERFSRRKHAPAEAPYDAIQFCLQQTKLSLDDIDYIGTGWADNGHLDMLPKGDVSEYSKIILPQNIFSYKTTPPIFFVKHHLAHIMSSYFQSGFHNAACLVIDGRGEAESITLARMDGDKLHIIRQYDVACSLGAFYDSASKYCGLEFTDAGKLMGLAPYGTSNQKMPLSFDPQKQEFVHLFPVPNRDKIVFSQLQEKYLEYFRSNNYPYKPGDKTDIMSYIHFAASAQKTIENIILDLAKILKASVKSDNLVISGGVGLNCTANGVVDRSGLFKNIFIHPGTNDGGASIGAALEVFRHLGKFKHAVPKQIDNVYYGSSYSDETIEKIAKNRLFKVKKLSLSTLANKTASLLQKGRIIAWFQGGFEFGPRALGARSFLANPTNRATLNSLNILKSREIWRPLSPMILDTHYSEVFEDDNPQNLSQFMLKTCPIKTIWRSKIPALTHIDGTSRPQILTKKANKLLYEVVVSFYKKTGVPIIINTSFNVKNQPIVNTPAEALSILENNPQVDALIIGGWLVCRK